MVVGLIVEEISNVDAKWVKVTGAQIQVKVTGSRYLPSQYIYARMQALCTMQGLVVVRLIVEKIWNVNINCVKDTGAQNIDQGHWVNIPAKSGRCVMQGMMVVVEL